MTILQVIPAQQQMVDLSQEKAEYFAMQQLEAFEKEVPEREVVSRRISKTVSDGELVLKTDYVFREDIAQQEENFAGRKNAVKSSDLSSVPH